MNVFDRTFPKIARYGFIFAKPRIIFFKLARARNTKELMRRREVKVLAVLYEAQVRLHHKTILGSEAGIFFPPLMAFAQNPLLF